MKKGRSFVSCLTAVLVIISVFMPARITSYAASETYEEALQETKSYMASLDTNPAYGSEWFVFDQARTGMDLNSAYFKTYYNHIANYLKANNGQLTTGSEYSYYSREILVLTSLGYDARNVAGYNLFDKISVLDNVTKQGFNGPVWALLAYECNPAYRDADYERELIGCLLAGEKDNGDSVPKGGFALMGTKADVDITGMAIQALAPFYGCAGYEDVTEAIDRAVLVLSLKQQEDGGFCTMNAATSESAAQVVTALCSVGIDPGTDSRFIKNGSSAVDNLLTYHIDGSGFMHTKANAANNGGGPDGTVNGTATIQCCYALASYDRLVKNQKSLFDLSDITLTIGGNGDGSGTGLTDPKQEDSTGTDPGTDSDSGTDSSADSSADSSDIASGTASEAASAAAAQAGGAAALSGSRDTDAGQEDADEGGWSFTGETYIPQSAAALTDSAPAQDGAGLSADAADTAAARQENGLPVWSVILICAAAAAMCIVLFLKKRRKGDQPQ